MLGDIANAIREQNGTSTQYRPGEMAAAVLALDGTKAGDGSVAELGSRTGVINGSVFSAIADAIRAQNGLTTTYKPREMAQAIRDLVWDVGVKMRALLHSDGVLEINYVDGRQSLHSTADVSEVWEVSTDGYSTWTDLPWCGRREEVKKVYIDSSVASVEWPNVSYLCGYLPHVTDVYGLENLVGVTNVGYLFATDGELETIWDEGFDRSGITTGTYPFNGCYRLVGGHLTVAQNSSSRTLLHNGAGGLTTNPDADERKWAYFYVYPVYGSDGTLSDYEAIVDATDETDYGLISSRGTWMRVVGNAEYRTYLSMPWSDIRAKVRSFTFYENMDGFAGLSMAYWFASCTAEGFFVSGLSHAHPTSLYFCFSGCSGVTTLDLTGLDPSTVTKWGYAFASMDALTTIKVDSTWTLPSGVSSVNKGQCFYGDKGLVGGNGTVYDSSKVSADMAVIDTADTPGYLTSA
ncbi:MAG: hypothetical protein ACOX12_01635 [Eggerthellaceae bacterium]